jgi:hypothetical protein
MVTRAKLGKRERTKTEWEKLSKKEQERLTDDYFYCALSGKNAMAKKQIRRIAKLKGIRIRRPASRR